MLEVEEWTENPVTEALKSLLETHLKELEQTPRDEFYFPFEPQKTQEVLAGVNGAIDTLEHIINALEGDWSFFEEEEESDEPERD